MKDYNDNDIVDTIEMNGSNDIEMRATFPLLESICESNLLQPDKMKDTTLGNWIEIDNVIYELQKCEKWKCDKCLPSSNGPTVDSYENNIYNLDKCDFEKDLKATATECKNDAAEPISNSSINTDRRNISFSEEMYGENKRVFCSVCSSRDSNKDDSETIGTTSIARCNSDSLEFKGRELETNSNDNKGTVEVIIEGLLDNQQTSTCIENEFETSTGEDESCTKITESVNGEAVLDIDNTNLADDLLAAINNPNLFSDCEDSDDDVFDMKTKTTATLPQCANYFRTRINHSGQTQSESAILDNFSEKTDEPHHLTVSDSAIISALRKRTIKCNDSGAKKKSVHFAIFPYVIEIPRVSDLEQEFLETELEIFGNYLSVLNVCL